MKIPLISGLSTDAWLPYGVAGRPPSGCLSVYSQTKDCSLGTKQLPAKPWLPKYRRWANRRQSRRRGMMAYAEPVSGGSAGRVQRGCGACPSVNSRCRVLRSWLHCSFTILGLSRRACERVLLRRQSLSRNQPILLFNWQHVRSQPILKARDSIIPVHYIQFRDQIETKVLDADIHVAVADSSSNAYQPACKS